MRTLLGLLCVHGAIAHIQFRDEVPNSLHVPGTEAVGHFRRTGGGPPNYFGVAFRRHGFKWTKTLCEEDSDGDGITNGHELGDPCCVWKPGDAPSRTYAISHPGNTHSSTAEPMPTTCDDPVQTIDVVAAGDPQFYKFYYMPFKERKQTTKAVSAMYEMIDRIAHGSRNNCGAAPELAKIRNKLHFRLPDGGSDELLCGVCEECCGREYAEDQHRCDACVEYRCPRAAACPQLWGSFGETCKCSTSVQFGSCSIDCVCKDAYQLPVRSVCNPWYCPRDQFGFVELRNRLGRITCAGEGLDFCRATYNYSTHRMAPSSAYKPSMLSLEGALAQTFGAYKAMGEISGDTNKAVANAWASLAVFAICIAIFASDARWMLQNLATIQNASIFVLAVITIDLFSGVLHICLDNPNFATMPVIGPQCMSFQTHHDSPNRMLQVPWFGYLSEHHSILAIVLATVIGNFKQQPLRIFLLYSAVLSEFMMASHRWSHMHPLEMPWLVSVLCKAGILLPVRMHSYHHVTYDCNFCIFTGWCNPLLNFSLIFVHHRSRAWLFALGALVLAPLALSFEITRTTIVRLLPCVSTQRPLLVAKLMELSDKTV